MFEFKMSITPLDPQKFKDTMTNGGLEFLHELHKELGCLIMKKFKEPELKISNLIIEFDQSTIAGI